MEIELSDNQNGRCKATCRQLGLSAWGSSLDNAVAQVITLADAYRCVLKASVVSGIQNAQH